MKRNLFRSYNLLKKGTKFSLPVRSFKPHRFVPSGKLAAKQRDTQRPLSTGLPPPEITTLYHHWRWLWLPGGITALLGILIILRWLYQEKQKALALESKSLADHLKENYPKHARIELVFGGSVELDKTYIHLALSERQPQEEKEQTLNQQNIGLNRSKMEELLKPKREVTPNELLQHIQIRQPAVVLGRAGIGKSTFCRYIVSEWANGRLGSEIECLIWLPLRKLSLNQYKDVTEAKALLFELLKQEHYIPQYLPLESFLKQWQQLSDKKVLFILDGYDEIVHHLKNHSDHKAILDTWQQNYHVLFTARPELQPFIAGKTFEVLGFSDDNIPQYIQKNNPSWKPEWSTKLIDALRGQPSMWGIAHVPLLLYLLCCVWEKRQKQALSQPNLALPATQTQLYNEVVELFAEAAIKRVGDTRSNSQKLLSQEQFEYFLTFLERLAYLGMKRNKLLFNQDELENKDSKEKLSTENFEQLISTGLLTTPDKDPRIEQCQYYFFHTSFQEYFAARYLAKWLLDCCQTEGYKTIARREKLLAFMRRNKYNANYFETWPMVAGYLYTNYVSKNQDFKPLQQFFDYWYLPPRDLVGIYDLTLLIRCLDEAQLPSPATVWQVADVMQRLNNTINYYLKNKTYEFINLLILNIKRSPLVIQYIDNIFYHDLLTILLKTPHDRFASDLFKAIISCLNEARIEDLHKKLLPYLTLSKSGTQSEAIWIYNAIIPHLNDAQVTELYEKLLPYLTLPESEVPSGAISVYDSIAPHLNATQIAELHQRLLIELISSRSEVQLRAILRYNSIIPSLNATQITELHQKLLPYLTSCKPEIQSRVIWIYGDMVPRLNNAQVAELHEKLYPYLLTPESDMQSRAIEVYHFLAPRLNAIQIAELHQRLLKDLISPKSDLAIKVIKDAIAPHLNDIQIIELHQKLSPYLSLLESDALLRAIEMYYTIVSRLNNTQVTELHQKLSPYLTSSSSDVQKRAIALYYYGAITPRLNNTQVTELHQQLLIDLNSDEYDVKWGEWMAIAMHIAIIPYLNDVQIKELHKKLLADLQSPKSNVQSRAVKIYNNIDIISRLNINQLIELYQQSLNLKERIVSCYSLIDSSNSTKLNIILSNNSLNKADKLRVLSGWLEKPGNVAFIQHNQLHLIDEINSVSRQLLTSSNPALFSFTELQVVLQTEFGNILYQPKNTLSNHIIQGNKPVLSNEQKAQVNYRDNEGNTALMLAVKHTQLEWVKLLLDSGANLKLANNHHQTALDIAFNIYQQAVKQNTGIMVWLFGPAKSIDKAWNICQVLMEQQCPVTLNLIDHYLATYQQACPLDASRAMKLEKLHEIFHLKSNVSELKKHENIEEFEKAITAGQGLFFQDEMKGLEQDTFFAYQIFSYVNLIMALEQSKDNLATRPISVSRYEAIARLKTELCHLYETVMLERQRSALTQLDKSHNLQRVKTKDKDDTYIWEPLYLQINQILQDLKPGQEYSIFTGWEGHSVYAVFTCIQVNYKSKFHIPFSYSLSLFNKSYEFSVKTTDKKEDKETFIVIRLDNLGEGCEQHEGNYQKGRAPFLAAIFKKSELATHKARIYIKNILKHVDLKKEESIPLLYDAQFHQTAEVLIKKYPELQKFIDSWPYNPQQRDGDCVKKSYSIGVEIRQKQLSEGSAFYKWLLTQNVISDAQLSSQSLTYAKQLTN